jgi:hypothetical protein
MPIIIEIPVERRKEARTFEALAVLARCPPTPKGM